MPLVRATINPNTVNTVRRSQFKLVLNELVPAALNSPLGPLAPGSICYISQLADSDSNLTVDVLLEIQAFNYPDRQANIDFRAEQIGLAMEQLFWPWTFAVWPVLVTAGWYRAESDPGFDGDMSVAAAMERIKEMLRIRK